MDDATNGAAGTVSAQPIKEEAQDGGEGSELAAKDPAAAAEALLEQILADLRELSIMLEAPTPETGQEIFDTQCAQWCGTGARSARTQPAPLRAVPRNRILLHYQHLHKLSAECDNVLIPRAVLEYVAGGRGPPVGALGPHGRRAGRPTPCRPSQAAGPGKAPRRVHQEHGSGHQEGDREQRAAGGGAAGAGPRRPRAGAADTLRRRHQALHNSLVGGAAR